MKSRTILVVDDTVIFRDSIVVALRRQGYDTLLASNGQEALELIRAHHPDLILLDVAMPVMGGLRCLKELRADQQFRDIPVIMLTAMSERDAIKAAGQMGIQEYLLKSQFSLKDMLAQVDELLQVAVPERD